MKEDIVRLTDPEHLTVVSIATSFGNNAYSMTVRGVEILYKPAPDLDAWRAKPGLGGVPLLSPWANRIDADAFYANGKKYVFNPGLGNIRYDGHHLPIHGLVSFTDKWRVIRSDNASVTSRLEPWREPRGTGLAARRLFNSVAVIQYLHHYQHLRQELRWLSASRGALERSGATRNAL